MRAMTWAGTTLCLLVVLAFVACEVDPADEGTNGSTTPPSPRAEELLERVAASALPWAIHPDVLQPRNLYTRINFNTESCAPGVDLDGDGRAGCDDPQCWSLVGTNHICRRTDAMIALEEFTPAECSDGIDNDNDGLIDCEDVNSCDCGPPQRDVDGLMIGVAALPEHIAVVFPPADTDGFDLAIGGVRTPWERVHVTDLALEDIGDVIAVGDPDAGRVWMAFREIAPPETLHLFSWTESRGVASHPEIVRSEGRSETHESFLRCPDLELLVDPGGDLDLFYRQSTADGRSAVMRAHGDGTSGSWETQTVARSPDTETEFLEHTGCETMAAYDDFGMLQVLVMSQGFDPAEPPFHEQFPARLGAGVQGFFMDAKGEFRPTQIPDLIGWSPINGRLYSATSPQIFGPGAGSVQYGFDVDMHPIGYLFSGPTIEEQDVLSEELSDRLNVHLRFDASTLRFASYPTDDHPLAVSHAQPSLIGGFGGPQSRGWGVKLALDGSLYVAPNPDDPSGGEVANVDFLLGGSDTHLAAFPSHIAAPALQHVGISQATGQNLNHWYPVFAKGQRRFDVALCLEPEAHELVICANGIEEYFINESFSGPESTWPNPPTIIDSSIEDGDMDVATDLGSITVTLDTHGVPDEDIDVHLIPGHYASRLSPSLDPSIQGISTERRGDGLFEIRRESPLEFDTPYILSFIDRRTIQSDPSARGDSTLILTDFEPAQIHFRTGFGGYPDPRLGERLDCDDTDILHWERDASGYCHHSQKVPWTATAVSLRHLAFDRDSAGGEQPWLVNPAGERVDGTLVPHDNSNSLGWAELELGHPITSPGGGCCGGACNADGVCGDADCAPQGDGCGEDGACCSGLCDPDEDVCVRCRPQDATCVDDEECCGGRCTDGVCGVDACVAESAICELDVDCCEGFCGGGLCFASECLAEARSCGDDSECCEGSTCEDVGSGQGVCRSDIRSCNAEGDACTPGGGGTWQLHYPEGIESGVGVPVHELDRIILFEVEQAPLELVSTQPADEDTDVPVDVDIILTFDGPAIFGTAGATEPVALVDEETSTAVTLSPIQESPSVWRVLHPPLQPATRYIMTLSRFIYTVDTTPLVGAPITVTFETAP